MPLPALVALTVVLGLLVLIPTRRLYTSGWRGPVLWGYFLLVLAMALVIAEIRVPARFLIPILVVAYLAPFVTARAGFDRLLRRGGPDGGPVDDGRPPPKDVTPPDERGG